MASNKKFMRLRNSLAFCEVISLFGYATLPQKVSLKKKKNQQQQQNVNRSHSTN